MSSPQNDRYEPLPSIPELPGWIWRKLPKPAKILVALLPVIAVVLYFVLSPGIDEDKDQRAQTEAQQLAQNRASRLAAIREEQQPRTGSAASVLTATGASDAALVAGRKRALDDVSAAILKDARTRGLAGDIRRVECEPYPRTVEPSGAETDLSRRTGTYSCLAVTSDVNPAETQGSGIIGHPYRLLIDFESGKYGFCKITGRPGEGSLARQTAIGVPQVCGGR